MAEQYPKFPYWGNLTPRSYVNLTLMVSLTIIFLVLWVATNQPHFQVSLSWDSEKEALVVSHVATEARGLDIDLGDQLVAMSDTAGNTIRLQRKFLTALPKDRRDHYQDKRSYFEDRKKLYEIARNDLIIVTLSDGRQVKIRRDLSRSTENLSKGFWWRVSAGLFIWICGISVWLWKPGKPELAALGLSSTGLMICATGQALYADIPNIYSPQFDWWLNFLVNGSLMAASCSMVGLVFYYPKPLRYAKLYGRTLGYLIPATLMVCLLEDWRADFSVLDQALYIDDAEIYATVISAYCVSLTIVLAQLVRHRQDPGVAKQLWWTSFVIIFGPGIYVLLRAIPTQLGTDPLISRDVSWMLISLIYLILVIAVAKLDLFSLNRQFVLTAWRWVLLGLAFLTMDLLMVSVFSMNFQESLFFLFSLVLIIYIPMRQRIYQWLSRGSDQQNNKRFTEALSMLIKDSTQESALASESWRNMLLLLFNPVSIVSRQDDAPKVGVEGSGVAFIVIGNRFSPAYYLEHADQGARLFSDEDVILVKELQKIFERLWDYQEAFISGQFSERKRIRMDLHDHVGHKILSMIHGAPDKTTRGLAEDAMKELGASIRNIKPGALQLEKLGEEIREIATTICMSTNLTFAMTNGLIGDHRIANADIRHGLVNLVRETLNNTVRHSGADKVAVDISLFENTNRLKLVIKDNGSGFDPKSVNYGDGLSNIRERIRQLGGTVSWFSDDGLLTEIVLILDVEKDGDLVHENIFYR